MQSDPQQFRATFCTEEQNPDVVDQLFCLRKVLFVDTLNWELLVHDGRERDQFDTQATVHCGLFRNGNLVAGFRGMRTDQPYLAEAVFPQLAAFRPYPKRHDIWEISRLGMLPAEKGVTTGRILYSLMFYFAHRFSAKSLVALGEVKQERLLTQLGIKTRRYGPPQDLYVGIKEKISIVAGETPVGIQSGHRFEALLKLLDNVEIKDETLVLGSERLSA